MPCSRLYTFVCAVVNRYLVDQSDIAPQAIDLIEINRPVQRQVSASDASRYRSHTATANGRRQSRNVRQFYFFAAVTPNLNARSQSA